MAGEKKPGPMCQIERPSDIQDGTSALFANASPAPIQYLPQEDVSIELKDAPRMCVPTNMRRASLAQIRVLAWLREHKVEIADAESKFRVDRRAIAGAIAWEALFNIRGALEGRFGRFVGPAKSHVWDWKLRVMANPIPVFPGTPILYVDKTDDTLVKQVDDAGWLPTSEQLPKQSYGDRTRLLGTPGGAITYIAAAMNAAAYLAEKAGFPSIRKQPQALTFFWQKKDLRTWEDLLKRKPRGTPFQAGPDPTKDMDRWVLANVDYLEDAVGACEL